MNKYWVWLSSIYKIGAKTQNKLLEEYKTPEKIWRLTKEKLKRIKFLDKEKIEIITNRQTKENIPKYIEYMEKNNIEMITIKDKNFPTNLRNIYDPPIVLYVKGNKDLLDKCSVAVVGSRNCSQYGKLISKKFAYELANNNIIIVSGLARGIDTYAHIGAITIKNSTIAVMRVWIRQSVSSRK